MPFQCWVASGWPKCCHSCPFPAQCPAWPGLPCPAGAACRGRRGPTAAAAGWAASSSFPRQQSLLYCNHTIIMPLKCHIHRNPHKQGISSCQEIVVLLLMTHFPPAAPLGFFLKYYFFPSLFLWYFLSCFVSEL